jgi:CHAT domain-containing protein
VRRQLTRRLEELSWYSARIDDHQEKGGRRNARRDARLRAEVVRCERELASLFHRLEVEESPIATVLAAEPAGLDELSQSLAPDETAVEFFVAEGRVSAFIVRADRTSAKVAYADVRSVERHLTGLRFQLEKFGLGNAYASAHQSALRRSADSHLSALYADLLAPIESELEGQKLIVVPHGLLHYIPFHALRRADGRYLVEDAEISYAPSATVHRLCAGRPVRSDGAGRLLAVGLSDALTPHITEELASVAGCFAESVRLEGDRASKSAFLDLAPRSRFLHIATHGFFRQDNPMFSSVRLADGPLNFYDVFDLELDAELVTLSACNTGLNKLSPGDELSGLMRGFLYAGAPSLMVSLWAVHDRSTSELMRSFYAHLAAGASKRRALQLAQLEGLERSGHPYYWAPFILMGKG